MPTDAWSQDITQAPFPYLRWAKRYLTDLEPTTLGLSGCAAPGGNWTPTLPPEGVDAEGLFRERIAARYGVTPDRVHPASGSSAANFLIHHVFARGGRVVAELPTYEALLHLPGCVGAEVVGFGRPPESRHALDLDALDAALEDGADLISVTDLHNPSGVRLSDAEYDALATRAEATGARVLVDEVYLDFDDPPRPSAATRHPAFLATNSLTKAHGLGDLRAGWILGTAEDIRALAVADDLVNPVLPPVALWMAADYLPHADGALAETRAAAAAAVDVVDAWVHATPGAAWHRPDAGLTGFVHLTHPDGSLVDGDALARMLRDEHGIQVVPGSFFQMPSGLRLSCLPPDGKLDAALEVIRQVLAG